MGYSDRDTGWAAHPRYAEPSYRRLAMHAWRMGQVLQPAQLQAQERALLEHVGLRAQLLGLPSYGVARLQWNDEQLRAGEVFVDGLTVVFPSGLVVDVPGNATLSNRSLSLPKGAAGVVPLFVHVRKQTRDAAGQPQYTGEHGDPPGVERVVHELELTTSPTLDDAREPLKLAELEREDGAWRLNAYAPPLLRVGAGVTPFLLRPLADVLRIASDFESELVRRAGDALAGSEQLTELRRLLSATYRLRALLADHGVGAPTRSVAMHPYHVFAAVRDFYLDSAVFQGKAIERWPLAYRHDDAGASFVELVAELETSLRVQTRVSPRLRFERDEYWYITERFPDELSRAHEVFLLVEPTAGEAAALDDLKLASPLRATEVYTRALEGVPRRSVPSLSFSEMFGNRAVFFELDCDSAEWKHAVDEGSVCFAALPQLEDVSASLFWRRGER